MILRIEIDPFTKSGKKVYEFIESLKDKNGINYIDFNEEDYLTEKDLEEIEERVINEMAEEYELLHTNKKIIYSPNLNDAYQEIREWLGPMQRKEATEYIKSIKIELKKTKRFRFS